MRQIGATFLGLWYALTLSTSLVGGLKLLSGEHSQGLGQHYVLAGLLWACGVGIASYFAGLRSQKYPVLVAVLCALLPPLLFTVLLLSSGGGLELDYIAEPFAFGWTPSANFVFGSLSVLVLMAGLAGGLQARVELQSASGEYASDDELTLGVKKSHWWWLWFPMSSWACALPSAVYLCWLLLASGWHWIFHPSIWFNWRWWLFFSLGSFTTYLPYTLLTAGIGGAWDALARGRSEGASAVRVSLRFMGWGYGCAFIALWISVLAGEWVFSKLPIISERQPWWIPF
jgi:hypothetical protein